MGADGWVVLVKRSDWDAQFPDLVPTDIGLSVGMWLGVDAAFGYYGDNLFEPTYGGYMLEQRYTPSEGLSDLTEVEKARRKEALAWFEGNAETHMVWT